MKKFLAFLLASFLLVSLCACGDKGGASSEILISVGKTEQVEVKAAENVFPENTVVEIKAVTSGDQYTAVDTALKSTASKFEAYDITAKSENVTVQPNGTVKATFNIPQSFDINKVAVVYVSDEGKVETLPFTVDKDTKTVTAELSHFSFYAVIEKLEPAAENVTSDVTSSDDTSEVTSEEKNPSKPTESSKAEESGKPNTSVKPEESSKPEVQSKPNSSVKPEESSKPQESSKPAHTHSFSDATCTSPKKCSCGATEGKALGHDYIDEKCSRCGAVDATYKALTSGYWALDVVSGDRLYAFSFVFSGEEPNASVGVGNNMKNLPEEFQNDMLNNPEEYADSLYKVGNETYYIGMGDGTEITFKVDKNTVVITQAESTNTITMTRTAGDKYTITAVSGSFMDYDNSIKVGQILNWKKAEIAES